MKTRIWKNYYDIVILPPKPVAEYARALSKKLHKYGATFVLGKRHYIPHISLFHIPVKPEKFTQFEADIASCVKGFKADILKTGKLARGMIVTNKPKWLQALHTKVLSTSFPYIDWDYGVAATWGFVTRLSRQQREIGQRNIRKYGAPFVGSTFFPHITITDSPAFNDAKEDPEILHGLKFMSFRFKVKEIYICELGPHHSCQRIVKKIRL